MMCYMCIDVLYACVVCVCMYIYMYIICLLLYNMPIIV